MADRFTECLPRTFEFEGGWTDDPHDLGGRTNKGITIGVFSTYTKQPITPKLVKRLRALTDEQAGEIYKALYWMPLLCPRLPRGIDFAAFDFGVNSGIGASSKRLQECVGAKADGVIGVKTLAAISAATATKEQAIALAHAFIDARKAYVKTRPTFWKHGKGWYRRCEKVRVFCLADIEQTLM